MPVKNELGIKDSWVLIWAKEGDWRENEKLISS